MCLVAKPLNVGELVELLLYAQETRNPGDTSLLKMTGVVVGGEGGGGNCELVWKKNSHPAIFSNLKQSRYCEKSVLSISASRKGRMDRFFCSKSEFQMFSSIFGRYYCAPLQDTNMAFPY